MVPEAAFLWYFFAKNSTEGKVTGRLWLAQHLLALARVTALKGKPSRK